MDQHSKISYAVHLNASTSPKSLGFSILGFGAKKIEYLRSQLKWHFVPTCQPVEEWSMEQCGAVWSVECGAVWSVEQCGVWTTWPLLLPGSHFLSAAAAAAGGLRRCVEQQPDSRP